MSCTHNNSLVHILKPHKSSTNLIILELNYKDRAASIYIICIYIEYLNAFNKVVCVLKRGLEARILVFLAQA